METNTITMEPRERHLQAIRDAADKLGRPPTYKEMDEMDGPCTSTLAEETNDGTQPQ
jgi:hypothetical protein